MKAKRSKIGAAVLAACSAILLAVTAGAATIWNLRNASDTMDLISVDDSGNMRLAGNSVVSGSVAAAAFNGPGGVITSEHASVSIGVTGAEVRKAVVRISNLSLATPSAGNGTNHIAGVKIATFPEGRILVHGVVATDVYGSTNSQVAVGSAVKVSLGTTVVTTVDDNAAVPTGTGVNLLPLTTLPLLTNKVGAALSAAAQFDGTSAGVPVYLNTWITNAVGNVASTNVWNGTIIIHYTHLGDY